MAETPDLSTSVAVMSNNIEHIQDDIKDIKANMIGSFVTNERHNALASKVKLHQQILFSMIGVVVIGFLTAVVNFFISRP